MLKASEYLESEIVKNSVVQMVSLSESRLETHS